MKIYFAGSICGGRRDVDWYKKIIKTLETYGQVITEHVGCRTITKLGETRINESKIFKRDIEYLKKSDLLVAEVSTPSLGVGYEIAQANFLNKPVLCLFRPRKNKKLSTMIIGNNKLIIREYRNIKELKKIIDSFFAKYKNEKKIF